jgi:signal transduction histidine kinase
MNRPWKTWSVFGLCLAVLLTAMGWVSWTVVELDRAQAQARQQADLEEKVRLALWRMDSTLTPLIAQESARPYFLYQAFNTADSVRGRDAGKEPLASELVPSPLLTQVFTNVLLYFQIGPDGKLTSPQVPTGKQRQLAEAGLTTRDALDVAAERLRHLERVLNQQAAPELVLWLRQNSRAHALVPTPVFWAAVSDPSASPPNGLSIPASLLSNGGVLVNACPPPQPGANQTLLPGGQPRIMPPQPGDPLLTQAGRNDNELQVRAQNVQQAYDQNVKNTYANFNVTPPGRAQVMEGPAKPVWFGDTLLLARRVAWQGRDYVQGCWLDWPALRQSLLAGVQDLLPQARLEPLKSEAGDPHGRVLAALPLRIDPGPAPKLNGIVSPTQLALVAAWICAGLAITSVAVLLHGVVTLSERRAAFVSAVTHELRTPLTTFKMYSEMLADGMVAGESKRRQYLDMLCSEANRLSHLVENVLAYARLERGSARGRVEQIALRQVLERVKPRLLQRAGQAGLTLVEDADAQALAATVHADVTAVEQILFNLVDNACKYAAPAATEKIIHLEALREQDKFILLRVRDHGQGISAEAARRLFQPFSKSASEAASTAPGVGLGLALCRRLSRSMGGDLRLDGWVKDGACFVLSLPVST